MKFRYIGRCAKGFVQFVNQNETVMMPQDEAVEVPEWLAAKLARNNHFEKVEEKVYPTTLDELVTSEPKARKKPGPKPKVKPEVSDDADRSEAGDAQEA